ncbi:hypothetical protein [Geobacter sp. AOG2]|uniref:hypothetical protein n=1 Tax=Geobacter sp. AOG2 TaxID=1566347 RepID=UPI001CC47F8B|nr:hypothetical protein [Geobacter sp. AOG2]GFE61978.1 hypothetical protein AOG2_25660 [Geobacter sp. AOG2]
MAAAEEGYGIGFFVEGKYHVLCHDGKMYRFHILTPDSAEDPVRLTYYQARSFVETHPVCTNISLHQVRIMPYREIENILQGRQAESSVQSLAKSGEEEEEEPLH